MDGRKGISDRFEVGVVVDVCLVPYTKRRVSPRKPGSAKGEEEEKKDTLTGPICGSARNGRFQ